MIEAVNLNLPVDKLNVILAGLAELPFRVSAETISEVQRQAHSQLQPAQTE